MSEHDSNKPAPQPAAESTDCWERIGVCGGDRSCAKLAEFVHCRNCPVFAAAGERLLDREPPAGYREEWTRHFAAAKAEAAAGKQSVVVFRIASEWLALPTLVLQEVVERRAIHSLPHQRNPLVLGLANVRGELLVCISMPDLLGGEDRPRESGQRLLVTGWRGQRTAFPVDEVYGIHRFQPQELQAAVRAPVVCGLLKLDGRIVGVLDAENFFAELNGRFA